MKEGSFLQAFKNEVSIMKKLDHHHVVTFIASYTEEKCFNILMTPVAEFNLERLLELPSSMENGSEHRSTLPSLFRLHGKGIAVPPTTENTAQGHQA